MKDALKAIGFLILAGAVLYSPIAAFFGLGLMIAGIAFLAGIGVYSVLGDEQIAIVIGGIVAILITWFLYEHITTLI